ncbi:MAG: 3'(2'),5'-bisphosphate nucleotidase CysQ [Rikenellaceae bacterium]
MLQQELIDYLLVNACNAAILGAREIMKIYDSSNEIDVNYKSDATIITEADTVSHNTIKRHLSQTRIPLLSEEGRNMLYEERYSLDLYWLVDPLDGTREFVKHNGEFVVSIAFMSAAKPLFGVILQPATGRLYFSDPSRGSFLIENSLSFNEELRITDLFAHGKKLKRKVWQRGDKLRVGITRSHLNEETKEFLEQLEQKYEDVEIVTCGSSLKFCYIAEDKIDAYVRFTRLYDWDLAAGVAIAESVGANTLHLNKEKIAFNKQHLEIDGFVATFPTVEI